MVICAVMPYIRFMALRTKLDRNGRIVLPAEARRALGIEAGDALSVEVDGDSLVLRTFAATVDAARTRLRESLGAEATASLSDDLIALRRSGLWRD